MAASTRCRTMSPDQSPSGEESVATEWGGLRRLSEIIQTRALALCDSEHLVMAAHVCPLTVKLILEKEGHYAPTDEDRAACLATGLLLVETQWVEDCDGWVMSLTQVPDREFDSFSTVG